MGEIRSEMEGEERVVGLPELATADLHVSSGRFADVELNRRISDERRAGPVAESFHNPETAEREQ